jgi:hypothetical protein
VRRILALFFSALLLWSLIAITNHYLASWHVYLFVGGLFVTFGALQLPLRAGLYASLLAGLLCDAGAGTRFGLHAVLFGLVHGLVFNLRGRLDRDGTVVQVVVALLANLACFSVCRSPKSAPARARRRVAAAALGSALVATGPRAHRPVVFRGAAPGAGAGRSADGVPGTPRGGVTGGPPPPRPPSPDGRHRCQSRRPPGPPGGSPLHVPAAHFLFLFCLGAMLLVLAADLAYQQLFRTDAYKEVERMQNERRVLLPGPRGEIVDREGRVLVGNRSRWAVVLYLGELRQEFLRERIQIRKNYREAGDKDMPTRAQMERIARATVVQRYLDQVNAALGSKVRVDSAQLQQGFQQERLLPYTLVDDLSPEECARLIERLPVRSPLQVYASSTRYYPYDSAAAHTLGYVSVNPDIDAQDFPGEDLHTFKMKGSIGRDGLEKQFDARNSRAKPVAPSSASIPTATASTNRSTAAPRSRAESRHFARHRPAARRREMPD